MCFIIIILIVVVKYLASFVPSVAGILVVVILTFYANESTICYKMFSCRFNITCGYWSDLQVQE